MSDTRTKMECVVLSAFDDDTETTECELKTQFDDDTEKRWLRSVLTKLVMKRDLIRTKRYNRKKHCAEWIYSLPK